MQIGRPVPWWLVVACYAAILCAAYVIHPYHPHFFSEDGYIEMLAALMFGAGIVLYRLRGLQRAFGWFPAVILLLMMDRELTFSRHFLQDLGMSRAQYKHMVVPPVVLAVVAYAVHFLVYRSRALLAQYRAEKELSILVVTLSALSAVLAYLGEKVLDAIWMEETTETLFALVIIYALCVTRFRPEIGNEGKRPKPTG